MTPEEHKAMAYADDADKAWSEVAPLLHPTVAHYLHTLTAHVFWLHKEIERLQAEIKRKRYIIEDSP